MGKSRYYNRNVTYYDITFDSLTEGNHYLMLRSRESEGEIRNLKCQVKYELQPRFKRGKKTIPAVHYTLDFEYEEDGKVVVEEIKKIKVKVLRNGKKKKYGTITPVSQLKAKMFQYRYPDIDFRMVIYEEVA